MRQQTRSKFFPPVQTEENGEEGPLLKNRDGFVFVAPPLVGGRKLETHFISLFCSRQWLIGGVAAETAPAETQTLSRRDKV